MNISDFLQQSFTGNRQRDMVGAESDWLNFCTLKFPLGKVHIVDPGYIGDETEGCVVTVPAGESKLFVKAAVYGNEVRIARVRVTAALDEISVGQKIDETGTDSGSIGIYDFQIFSSLFAKNRQAAEQAFESARARRCGIIALDTSPGGSMALTDSGFGDGTFPVHELLCGTKRVGLEVTFIPLGTPYPFEVMPEEPVDENEEIHTALVEKIWDNAWTALNKGEPSGREFFATLTPRARAALALRIFINYVITGNAIPALMAHAAQPWLNEQIVSAFELFGLDDYANPFKQVCASCNDYWNQPDVRDQADFRERLKIWIRFEKTGGHRPLADFRAWKAEASKDPNRIARAVANYVRSHHHEFPDIPLK